ncbi:MAG: exostosin family protein [Chloroflexi bacterium]|nr:exostosin family protein [Chloroflexota bacterium]
MLRIYADRRFVKPGQRHVVMLYPFWGKLPEDPRNPASGRFDRYVAQGRSLFALETLRDADVALLPAPWEDVRGDADARLLAHELAAEARAAGKPVVAFFWSDSTEPLPLDDALVFRTSLHASRRRPADFAMPAWSEDLVERYLGGELSLRPKRERPVVGFCGWAGAAGPPATAAPLRLSTGQRAGRSFKRRLQVLAAALGIKRRDTTRARVLRLLAGSGLIDTNFIIRDRYLGGPVILKEAADAEMAQRIRLEFVQNMVESDYVLCVRGVGNYSYRLYETLSCGRIPIFVNTDCVLPYDFAVDWKQYCVWVEEHEIVQVAEKVAAFHAGLSEHDFGDLQRACRRFWQERLSPEGFFTAFHQHLPLPVAAKAQ